MGIAYPQRRIDPIFGMIEHNTANHKKAPEAKKHIIVLIASDALPVIMFLKFLQALEAFLSLIFVHKILR